MEAALFRYHEPSIFATLLVCRSPEQDLKFCVLLSDPSIMGKCGYCGSDQAQVKCAKCKSVFYCDKNCQKKDWKLHKKDCQEPLVEPLDAVDVSNLDLKVEVRKKANGKYGVFATVALKEGEMLCYYDGVTKDANTKIRMRKLPDGYAFKLPSLLP